MLKYLSTQACIKLLWSNPWAQWLKPKWEQIKNDLKDFGFEICGENMYGEHSIIYSGLEEHFYVFGIRDIKRDVWLSWEEVEYYSMLFDFKTVPVLFKSDDNFLSSLEDFENKINIMMKNPSMLSDNKYFETPKEGVVIRISDEFNCDMFFNSVFKYVRAKHVKTDSHWSKNWKRSYLNHELKKINNLSEIYREQIDKGLINI